MRVIVIVISRLLKHYLKAMCTRAPAYSRAIAATNQREIFQRVVKRSSSPISRGPEGVRAAVKMGIVQMGRVNDQMGQGRSV